ncbi:Dehydrogenase OXI1 [Fusarium oxysporum f. sp. albedinis]|nr:Dehydrogenase OXI1 [Fusarium oxysporum f. sp. albedinis]
MIFHHLASSETRSPAQTWFGAKSSPQRTQETVAHGISSSCTPPKKYVQRIDAMLCKEKGCKSRLHAAVPVPQRNASIVMPINAT